MKHSEILIGAFFSALLAACGGPYNASTQTSGLPPARVLGTPASEKVLYSLQAARIPRDLYIADAGTNEVDLLRNKTYRDVGVITNGVSGPQDVFLDRQGRLYVANATTSDVTEYAPGNTSAPIFTYSAHVVFPDAVTTDARGNVFEGDANGSINEYFQGSNGVVASCSQGGNVDGVAVDSSGDVFVDVFVLPSGPAELVEYPGGLSKCSATILGATLSAAGGVALDNNRNLLVCNGGEVSVIDPPYTNVTRTIGSGFAFTIAVTLNKSNTLAFVSDSTNNTVTVVRYPRGTNLTVLGIANGLKAPLGAVDQPNAVY
jgi:hypothetical protein